MSNFDDYPTRSETLKGHCSAQQAQRAHNRNASRTQSREGLLHFLGCRDVETNVEASGIACRFVLTKLADYQGKAVSVKQ